MEGQEFYKKYLNVDSPYEHQLSSWDQINVLNFPLLLKAPTGSGKTEAVLAPFLSQFINNKFHIAPRLLYVLPMRVLVNNVSERIKKYANRISSHISVEVQHGDVPNSPFFIGDIVVTTLDQFLYGFARASGQVGRHLDIPAGAIASSMVVFDEAHMYRDGFTFSIMRALMEILYKSRIPFVLMTATMPKSLEKSLFENIPLTNDQRLMGDVKINSELEIIFGNDPLYSNGDVCIPDKLLPKIKQKKTLIVVNQVARAQKIYEHIKNTLGLADENIVLIHSRFTRTDRKEHEAKAISLIPHKENGKIVIPEGVGIVVSTQVLEAGMDFSAELLLTELAPADSLIQRAGRCARYFGEKGEMIIFPVGEDKGNLPYEREHLTKTLAWLQEHENFNIKNFDEVCSFVDNTLDYQTNDYEATDTLIDLYECVLYADSEPRNIQLRKSKPVILVVLDVPDGSGEKVRKKVEKIVLQAKNPIIKENSIYIDTHIAWDLFKDKNRPIQWEIQWRYNYKERKNELSIIDLFKNKRNPDDEDARIEPFRTYIIDSKYYKQDKGIYPDVSFII